MRATGREVAEVMSAYELLCRQSRDECIKPLAQSCAVGGQQQEFAGQVPALSWLIAPPPAGGLNSDSMAPANSAWRKVRCPCPSFDGLCLNSCMP